MALTSEQVKNNLVTQILQSFPTAEVNTGSVLRDVMIDPQSTQIAALSEEIDYISYLNTFVQNAQLISDEDMDEIGANYGVVRGSGHYSTGSITFQSLSLPSQNIQIGADDGSGGISVKTLLTNSGNSYEFTTTQTVYLKTDATYNTEHGCYEVTAPIIANTIGSEFNLGVGTIRVLVDGISNITSVYNYTPTSGGTDRQNNLEFAKDIQSTILGSSKNIESGIDSILKSVDGVYEVKTLHPNSDDEPTEAGYAISYIRGSNELIENNYEINYVPTISEYVLNKRPVTRIISVNAYVNGQLKTLQQGIDYYLYPTKYEKDYDTIYYGTIYSSDKIVFLKTANGTPDPNSIVYITFAYNSLIEICQNTLNSQLNDYIVLGNILVAQSIPAIADFYATIKLKYNYNTEVVKNEIITGISNLLTTLPLGGDITQEEMFSYITTSFSEYISSVSYPFIKFCLREDETSSNEGIQLTYNKYITIDENSIKINFE